ncbi:MAG: polysaccharide biosynthesis C-terminal domain-containing protein, partial [Christensenellales bacterium]
IRLPGLTRRMLSISLPMALSSYMRSGLLTLEHMLIPSGLRRFGSGSEGALEQYGILHGMAFPVILYPQVLLASVSGLLVPEVSEEAARGNDGRIERIAHTVLRLTLAFSIGTAGVFLVFGRHLGELLYNNADSGRYILLLAPLIPVMYLDSAVDGILKGLGEQLYSMKVNILDSAMSIVLVIVLLPRFGTAGYILTVYITELVNGALSLIRLLHIIRPRLCFSTDICLPAATACMLSVICRTAPISAFVEQLGGTTAGICASITLYILIYSAAVFLPAAILRKKRTSTGTEISEKGLLLETKL